MTKTVPPDIVRAILLSVVGKPCRLIGSENLDDICHFRGNYVESQNGFRMPVGEALALAANAATIIALAWQIVAARRRRHTTPDTPPTVAEIDVLVIEENADATKVSVDIRLKLYAAVLEECR